MFNILGDISQNIPIIVGLIIALVVGLIAIYGLFDKKVKDKLGEENTLEDRIRNLYKEESDAQTKKITDLTEKVNSLEKEMTRVSDENKVFKDVFQGRDSQTLEFQRQGFDAIKKANELHAMLVEQKEIALQTNKNIERLATAIEKYLKGGKKQGGDNE